MGKHGITVRGDSLYCPLPLSVEPYWWCAPNCPHCYFRGLNHVWGKEWRPIDLDAFERKLVNGQRNANPRTTLAHCLARKKTMRVGNKTDPYQPIEAKLQRATGAVKVLCEQDWTFVIQTRFITRAWNMTKALLLANLHLVTLLPIISPGAEQDWEQLERSRTEPIPSRLETIQTALRAGLSVGVQGEPFIPGYHTEQQFRDMLARLKAIGVNRYNTYNFHFTAHVAKRLAAEVPQVDVERVWYYNQDEQWRPILGRLLDIARDMDMVLGCPDFVNSGPEYRERANTCCGIDVPNPCTFNTHYFKQYAQDGMTASEIIDATYDGSGDPVVAEQIVRGQGSDMFTLRDAGILPRDIPRGRRPSQSRGGFDL